MGFGALARGFVKDKVGQGANYLRGQGSSAVDGFDAKGAGSSVNNFLPGKGLRTEVGKLTGGGVGKFLGGLGGKLVGAITGNKDAEQKGRDFGESALGFKKGGRVKKSGKYKVHKREFVVSKKRKVTKKQKKKVAKRKKKGKK